MRFRLSEWQDALLATALRAMCNRQIGAGYQREAGTQLIYCDHTCYTDHCNGAFRFLEGQAKLRENSMARYAGTFVGLVGRRTL